VTGSVEKVFVMVKRRREILFNLLVIFGAILLITLLYHRDYVRGLLTPKSELQAEASSEPKINALVLKHLLDSGQGPVVVDLRNREEYANGHIPSAKNIPYDELEARALDELSPSDQIVLYCDCPSSGGWSRVGYEILTEQGFNKVSILTQGIEGWKKQGHALVR
jgi:rhodanese-related sulfurtransferase